MKKTKVVPLRIPEHLDQLAALSARDQQTDKATALRQWISRGRPTTCSRLMAEGRVSTSRAAELLELTVYALYHLAEIHGIELGQVTNGVGALGCWRQSSVRKLGHSEDHIREAENDAKADPGTRRVEQALLGRL